MSPCLLQHHQHHAAARSSSHGSRRSFSSSPSLAPALRRSGASSAWVAPRPSGSASRRSCCVVRADANRSNNSVVGTIDSMLKRYDFVSTGMGALCVTGWFWSHGQPPLEALSIAAVSTIIALVVNELVFTSGGSK